jgi:cell division protein FtsI/penicillin-binding protein 2
MNAERTFRMRSRILRLGLVVALLSLILRLTYIQIAQATDLSGKADEWIKADKTVNGERGTIYDRTGQKLVFTGVAYDINVDLDVFKAKDALKNGDTKEEYAKFLSGLLGIGEPEIMGYLNIKDPKIHGVGLGPKSQKVDASIHDKIEAMHNNEKFKGITTIRTDIRRYPNGPFASSVLGYYGFNDKENTETGMAGVEAEYNEILKGKPGRIEYYTDRDGQPLPNYKPEPKVPAVDGQDVVLTIDENIQHYVEDELNNIMNKYGPKHASIIVADPNNGEILALGNRPTYDPNHFADAEQSDSLWDNWALRAFEPGSTFKVFVLTAALAEHKLNLEETFPSGRVAVGGDVIKDWNNGDGWGTITYRQGVYHSSNVGFVKIGQKVGKDTLFDYLYKFGFNKPTGIDLPSESSAQLFTPSKMRDIDLASTSFGQGVSVTPMQQVAGVMAVANGGKVYQPHLVKELRDKKTGKTVKQIEPKVVSQVANEEVMATVRQVLEETVVADENKTNYIKGYHVAGKTGTAQVPKDGGGYEDDKYRLSFVGFAPANKPRLLVYVTVDQPSRNAPLQFGSIVAAPSGRVVMEQALRYLQVPIDPNDAGPDKDSKTTTQQQAAKPAEPVKFVKVPDFIGVSKDEAQKVSEQNGFKIQTEGEGPKVTGQWPDATYGQVPEGTQIKLYFGPEGSKDGKVKVPDLRGMSLREAMETLSLLNLSYAPDSTGSGYVTKQETPVGTLVPFGTPITLAFAPQS